MKPICRQMNSNIPKNFGLLKSGSFETRKKLQTFSKTVKQKIRE